VKPPAKAERARCAAWLVEAADRIEARAGIDRTIALTLYGKQATNRADEYREAARLLLGETDYPDEI
jgi:hypothetical protein